MSIFWKKKKSPQTENPKKDSKGEEDLSAIQRMKKLMEEGYGVPPEEDNIFAANREMTEKEYHEAIDALFPQRLNDFYEAVKSGADPFPVKTDDVSPEVPTMDDINGGGAPRPPMGGGIPPRMGNSLPGAIGAGARRCYPPMRGQGMHAGLEGGGMSMLPDPLLRFPINPRVLKHYQSRIWITYTGCAIIATHELVNRACTIPAEDAIAHGYKVICTSPTHKHSDQSAAQEDDFHIRLKKAADKMGLNEACVRLNYKKKVFGVGIAIPWVEFRDDVPSPSDKSGKTPYSYADEYNPRAIKPGSFRGFAVVDPHWLTYQWDKASRIDPTSPHFLEPTWIKILNKRIHRSWIIRVINSELPDIFKPVYLYGGLSLTQMIYERMWCADKLANEAPLLAMTKRLLIADGNLDQMISDPRHTNKFFNWINYFRDNFSIFVKKPSSNVTQLDTNLSELTALTMSQYQLVAAIAQIPVTKLLKNVPSGLQATGQYEWDDYAQSLRAIQQKDYTPLVNMFFELYCASNYPEKKDILLDIEWNPIDIPKETEIAQMCTQTVQYVAQLINTGLIDVSEGRKMLRKSNLPVFQMLSAEVPDILKKIEQAKDPTAQQQMGGMGMPGMEGGMGEGTGEVEGAPEQISPDVQRNDQIFKNAIKRYLSLKEGEEEGETDGETAGTAEGEESSEKGAAEETSSGEPEESEAESDEGNTPTDIPEASVEAEESAGGEGLDTVVEKKPKADNLKVIEEKEKDKATEEVQG